LTITASYPHSLIPLLLKKNTKTKQKRQEYKKDASKKSSERVSTHSQLPKNSMGKISISPISIPVLSGRKIREKVERESRSDPISGPQALWQK
jgi:hypothetical protein